MGSISISERQVLFIAVRFVIKEKQSQHMKTIGSIPTVSYIPADAGCNLGKYAQ